MAVEASTDSRDVDAEIRRRQRLYVVLMTMILLLGGYLRLNRFLLNRSLWLDEAYLALNIIERTPLELAGPLSYGQVAPIGFTVVVKLLALALGVREPVLRLIPLLSGLVSLPLFYLVAKRWLPKGAALLAVILFAASDALGDYAAQFKQYSSDVAITLMLILVATWFFETGQRGRYLVFASVGVIAVWFSHPSSIVLAGVGLYLILTAVQRKSYSEAVRVTAVAGCWLVSFAVTYILSIRGGLQSQSLVGYWDFQGGFLLFPPTGIEQVEAGITLLVRPFEDPLGFALYSGVVLLFALGAIDGIQKRGPRLFLLAPILVAVALSTLRLYPFSGRLLLFAVPLLLLTVVMGIVRLFQARIVTGRIDGLLAIMTVAVILFQPLRNGLARGLNPRALEETRPLMIRLNESYRPGDVVAVYHAAQYAFKYYSHLLHFDPAAPVVIKSPGNAPEEDCQEVQPLRGNPRVWVIFSHKMTGPSGAEEPIIVGCLDRYGQQTSKFEETGASLYLYDLRAEPSGPAPGD